MTILYRYRDVCDESGQMLLICDEYRSLKETPGGWWVNRIKGPYPTPEIIAHWLANKRMYSVRFVLSGAGKRFCYPTKAAALDSYRIRKARQIQHAQNTLAQAKLGLATAQRLIATGDDLVANRWGEKVMGNPWDSPDYLKRYQPEY